MSKRTCWWLAMVVGVWAVVPPAGAQQTLNCGPVVSPYLRLAATYREAGQLGGVLVHQTHALTLVCADRRARGSSVNVFDPEEGLVAPFGSIAAGQVTRGAWSTLRTAAKQATIANAASCFTAAAPSTSLVEFRLHVTWYGAGRENTFVITNQDELLPPCDATRQALLEAVWNATADIGSWENSEVARVF